jgi:Na+/proline symporter
MAVITAYTALGGLIHVDYTVIVAGVIVTDGG